MPTRFCEEHEGYVPSLPHRREADIDIHVVTGQRKEIDSAPRAALC